MSGMLDGIRIVSFAQLLQAPAGVQLLSDLGAETIKIERPGAGAWERAWSGGGHWVGGESLLLIAAGRNQRSLTVDLKTIEGQEIIWKLIDQADVVVENYRPGVMDRIGFGFEAVHKRNPKVVYCAASGYGSSGPYLNRPGQDLLAQAISGITSMSGKASDPPTPIGFAPVDQHSAALIAFGIMTALFHRSRTGLGQKVEVNLLTSALDLMAEPLTYLMNGAKIGQRSPAGLASGFHPGPYGVYQTQDGWIPYRKTHYQNSRLYSSFPNSSSTQPTLTLGITKNGFVKSFVLSWFIRPPPLGSSCCWQPTFGALLFGL